MRRISPSQTSHSPLDGNFFDVDEADFHAAFQGLTVSIALLARAVLPDMKARGWGRFLNLGSGSAKEPPRELRHVLGNTARASGVTLCKSLANEFGPYGVTVNSIGTGLFRTGFMEDFFSTDGQGRVSGVRGRHRRMVSERPDTAAGAARGDGRFLRVSLFRMGGLSDRSDDQRGRRLRPLGLVTVPGGGLGLKR